MGTGEKKDLPVKREPSLLGQLSLHHNSWVLGAMWDGLEKKSTFRKVVRMSEGNIHLNVRVCDTTKLTLITQLRVIKSAS